MNQYPVEYPVYSPYQYQAMQWQGLLGTLMGVAILIAMGAWAFSLVRKAAKGEEVKYPL
ncbi:MAG: cytosine permease [Dehalococcoidales bacterium]|jgi:cell division protein FtsX|nr:cytosine permease [Dehalococcoidales bacterium]